MDKCEGGGESADVDNNYMSLLSSTNKVLETYINGVLGGLIKTLIKIIELFIKCWMLKVLDSDFITAVGLKLIAGKVIFFCISETTIFSFQVKPCPML